MTRTLLILFIQLFVLTSCSIRKTATPIVLESDFELKVALEKELFTDTFFIKAGTYSRFNISINRSGSAEKPLVICAENQGDVVFSDSTFIVISGSYVELSGFYFKDGLPSNGMDGGKPVIDIKGDYNRITNCAFLGCHNRAGIASLYQEEEDRMPQYTRIDHCYFADNLGWRLYLDLGKRVPGDDLRYAMYYRIDHNYFSTPFKLGANTGSAMRIGLGPLGYGRCLIDNNLFERQNGEVELIENKSHENVYLNNTFRNCEAQMSFRQGHRTIFLHNHFIGDDPNKKCGGLSMWMDKHLVAGNYFSFPHGSYIPLNANQKPREDRFPGAVVRFMSGCKNFIEKEHPVGHLAGQKITFANNVIFNSPDYQIDFAHNHKGMIERYEKAMDIEVSGSFDNSIYNNIFLKEGKAEKEPFYDVAGKGFSTGEWKANHISGFLDSRSKPGTIQITKNSDETVKIGIPDLDEFYSWLKDIPGQENKIDLLNLANSSVAVPGENDSIIMKREPLTFKDVGPDWLIKNPSAFAQNGVYSDTLKKIIKENIEAGPQ